MNTEIPKTRITRKVALTGAAFIAAAVILISGIVFVGGNTATASARDAAVVAVTELDTVAAEHVEAWDDIEADKSIFEVTLSDAARYAELLADFGIDTGDFAGSIEEITAILDAADGLAGPREPVVTLPLPSDELTAAEYEAWAAEAEAAIEEFDRAGITAERDALDEAEALLADAYTELAELLAPVVEQIAAANPNASTETLDALRTSLDETPVDAETIAAFVKARNAAIEEQAEWVRQNPTPIASGAGSNGGSSNGGGSSSGGNSSGGGSTGGSTGGGGGSTTPPPVVVDNNRYVATNSMYLPMSSCAGQFANGSHDPGPGGTSTRGAVNYTSMYWSYTIANGGQGAVTYYLCSN